MSPPGELTYEDFSKLAEQQGISSYERIGFPDSYRQGFGPAIYADIERKLSNLRASNKVIVDVGPGCSDVPNMLIDACAARGHRLLLIDSPQMLSYLPDKPFAEKIPGPYPSANRDLLSRAGTVDAIIVYSVLHYIFIDGNVFDFLDFSLQLLAPGGEMLIGDIPNLSMRHRFFASDTGLEFHRRYTGDDSKPPLEDYVPTKIDDAVVFGLVMRARNAGCHAFVVPQPPDLPMSNRREDILIVKP